MTIYIPYYDTQYHIQTADSGSAKRIGRYWHVNGVIYGDTAYTTDQAARAYIMKQYSAAREAEYMPFKSGIINKP